MTKENLIQKILRFWFGESSSDPATITARMGFWFGADPAGDECMREKWAGTVVDALSGKLDTMGDTPSGRLALILLLDQFPRNLFRGTARAFEKDGRARYLMRDGMSRLMDMELSPIERCFFYMPLQHSEFLEDQESSVSRYSQLVTEVASEHREIFENFLRHAQQHLEVIARFGRFPHRNSILNRLSTAEEQEYLASNAPRFGQR